jgi:hypothetical protein
MSEFEYLAVFISIIFGISLTHILAGTIRSFYLKNVQQSHLVWTLYILLVMILNWWTAYSWRDQQTWSFDLFMIIIVWSIAHYLTAITLYPPVVAGSDRRFEFRRNWFLWAFISIPLTDILQTAARGDIFSPWYYLPFVSHYALLALAAIFIQKPIFHRWLPWYFLVTLSIWSFVVRRFLV